MAPATHINGVMSKMTALDGAHQWYEKQAAASKGPELAKMRAPGVQAQPDVFKNRDTLNILPDGIDQELNIHTA